MTVAILGDI